METQREFDALLRATRQEVDQVLAQVPDELSEARRVVTRELRFEPHFEELHAILEIAGFSSASAVCHEFPRRVLSLRVLAERLLSQYWGARRLCGDTLARLGELFEDLQRAAGEVLAELNAGDSPIADLSNEEQGFLLRIRAVLAWPEQRIAAAILLAPRLQLVAKQITSGNISETFPGLRDDEIDMFNQAVHLDEDERFGAARVCLDAVALRTFYEESGEAWDRSGYLDDAALIEQLKRSVREQLRDVETAYHVVDSRLQRQQDEALAAGLEDFVEELRGAKSRLQQAHVEAHTCLRGH